MLVTITCYLAVLTSLNGGMTGTRQRVSFYLTPVQVSDLAEELGEKPGTKAFKTAACDNLDLLISGAGES
jgi:hypothetical protein